MNTTHRVMIVGTSLMMIVLAHAAGGESPSLYVPPLLSLSESRGVLSGTLVPEESTHEFLPGVPSPSLGYNGEYLGPTILLERGREYTLDVQNGLGEVTTVHWHGMDIEAAADGGPRQPIEPGGRWTARFTVHQPSSTAWYHPHAMGTTASQVAAGLAGMIIVTDSTSPVSAGFQSKLPSTYGIDDLPVIIQDRRIDGVGMSSYRLSMPDTMHGFRGNVLVTNGAVGPTADVPAGWVRLRLLNGSNAAYLRLEFPAGLPANVIASDGGYLAQPQPIRQLVIAAGERYEVLVNVAELGGTAWIVAESDAGVRSQVLGLRSNGTSGLQTIPAALIPAEQIVDLSDDLDSLPIRRFVLGTQGMMSRTPFTINARVMDLSRIDERIELGTTEIWEIINAGPMQMSHSFHVHSTHFQVVSVNGEEPLAIAAGRKDTVIVPAGTTVKIAVRFDRHAGVFMYHCHMLEHEEAGLMGQLEVFQ